MADRRINFVLLLICQFCSFSVAQELSNPLDIGGVYTCVVPNSTVCNITYPVPESINFLSEIKDALIVGKIGQIRETESEECRDRLTQILCAEQYPQCMENRSIVTVPIPANCSNMLSSCESDFSSQYCDFTPSNISLGNCRPIQSRTSELTNYDFAECNQLGLKWLSNYVTEWMFQYLKRTDSKVRTVLQSTLSNLNEECKLQYRMFMCSGIGRCWHQGDRIELTVNKTDCLNLRHRCLSSSERQLLDPELQCDLWPDDRQLPTSPTDITPEPTTNNHTVSLISSTSSTSSPSLQASKTPDTSPTFLQSTATSNSVSILLTVTLFYSLTYII